TDAYLNASGCRAPATGRGIFFSRRRRHTRWPRDWSSDVCSSDLKVAMSNACCDIAEALGATAIVVPTFTGRTASAVARLRPRRQIGRASCRGIVWVLELEVGVDKALRRG